MFDIFHKYLLLVTNPFETFKYYQKLRSYQQQDEADSANFDSSKILSQGEAISICWIIEILNGTFTLLLLLVFYRFSKDIFPEINLSDQAILKLFFLLIIIKTIGSIVFYPFISWVKIYIFNFFISIFCYILDYKISNSVKKDLSLSIFCPNIFSFIPILSIFITTILFPIYFFGGLYLEGKFSFINSILVAILYPLIIFIYFAFRLNTF